MTRFERSGCWRISRNGNVHWVRPHDVERHDWERSGESYQGAEYWRAQLDSVRARGSSTARFVTPNATCPECGADVFFYQNQYGSRVYFDDLGPPWPKHPCTDSGTHSRSRRGQRAAGEQAPQARDDDDIIQIHAWADAAYVYPDSRFAGHHGHKPWHLAELVKRIRGKRGTFFILRDLTEGTSRKLFMSARSLPRSFRESTLVAVERGRISYLDLQLMQPREIPVTRIRSAAAFIDAMLESSSAGE
jgi:peptidoglycan/xylan/chitin deacetylase (PgdA/CDA1 family)